MLRTAWLAGMGLCVLSAGWFMTMTQRPAAAQGDDPGDAKFQKERKAAAPAAVPSNPVNVANPATTGNAATNPATAANPVPVAPAPMPRLVALAGMNLAVRNTTENNFTADTKRWGVEVLRDPYFGSVVYANEAGSLAAASARPTFVLKTLTVNPQSVPEILRMNTQTGEVWHFIHNSNTWRKTEEATSVPPGDYELFLVAGANNSFFAYRTDQITGKSWSMANHKWNLMPETP